MKNWWIGLGTPRVTVSLVAESRVTFENHRSKLSGLTRVRITPQSFSQRESGAAMRVEERYRRDGFKAWKIRGRIRIGTASKTPQAERKENPLGRYFYFREPERA
jgi:hypothetical protein